MIQQKERNEKQQQIECIQSETNKQNENEEDDCQYSKLFNHLKATAPLSSSSTTENIEEDDAKYHAITVPKIKQMENRNIKQESSINVQQSDDDRIVAQILTNLRAKYANFDCSKQRNEGIAN